MSVKKKLKKGMSKQHKYTIKETFVHYFKQNEQDGNHTTQTSSIRTIQSHRWVLGTFIWTPLQQKPSSQNSELTHDRHG